MNQTIDFYFDFSSPYGYFASLHIEKLAAQYAREIHWHPMLLGPAFKLMNTAPLVNTPLKGEYARHDIQRTARFHNILFTFPDIFPISIQVAARAMLWIQRQEKALAVNFAHTIYSAYFTENIDISKLENVVRIAGDLGVNQADLQVALNDHAIKEELKTAIDTALARGVFGSPFIIVDNEAFWGFDRFDQLTAFLKQGKI